MGRLLILAATLVAINLVPQRASAERYYPRCAWYDEWTSDCGFATLQQCRETISGVGGICKPNPYGPPAARPRWRRGY